MADASDPATPRPLETTIEVIGALAGTRPSQVNRPVYAYLVDKDQWYVIETVMAQTYDDEEIVVLQLNEVSK